MARDKLGVRLLRAVPADTDDGHPSCVFLCELLDRGSLKVAADSTGGPEPQCNGALDERIVE